MNIEDYISSGVLECYVLGQLTRTEAAKVEDMANRFPEVRKEIEQIEVSLENYATAYSKSPSASVKEKLMASISSFDQTLPQTKIVKIYRQNKLVSYFAAASTIFALLFGIAAFYYHNEWMIAKTQIAELKQDNEKIAAQNTVLNSQIAVEINTREEILSTLRDTNTKAIILKGLPLSPSSVALVFWNIENHSVFLDIKNLPIPPPDKQYQLWALQNGVPMNAGVFTGRLSEDFQKMKNIVSAEAFAITLENKGGSLNPTLDRMYVMGKI